MQFLVSRPGPKMEIPGRGILGGEHQDLARDRIPVFESFDDGRIEHGAPRHPERFLRRAYFAGGLESLKAVLLVESPTPLRCRQTFVSANALSRA